MRSRRFPLWTLLGVVLVVALLVGSGVFSSTPPTSAQRAAAIESVIRCPSCEDLSVADSSAPTAVTVRRHGAPTRRPRSHGPPDRGLLGGPLRLGHRARPAGQRVVEPGLGAAGRRRRPRHGRALVVVLVRRRWRGGATLDDDVLDGSADPVAIEERRRFLTQSLADADAEYLAGDLTDADYLSLRQRDLSRMAALGPSPGVPGPVPVVDGTVGRPR